MRIQTHRSYRFAASRSAQLPVPLTVERTGRRCGRRRADTRAVSGMDQSSSPVLASGESRDLLREIRHPIPGAHCADIRDGGLWLSTHDSIISNTATDVGADVSNIAKDRCCLLNAEARRIRQPLQNFTPNQTLINRKNSVKTSAPKFDSLPLARSIPLGVDGRSSGLLIPVLGVLS
jgi:hypothetical protein